VRARQRARAREFPSVVQLLPELEVQEALGRDHSLDPANPVRDLEEVPAVGAEHLHEQVELAGRDDDVVGLVPACYLVGHRAWRPRRADAHHRLRLEAQAERVRHPGHLEDVLLAESLVARPDGGFRDAQLLRDAAERLPPVALKGLDDALVGGIERLRRRDRPAANGTRVASLSGRIPSQCEAVLTNGPRLRQA
jgi:hypothetical protein